MPSLTRRLPRYCCHKTTDRAVVYLDGKAVYLGAYDSPESKARYKTVVSDWLGDKSVGAPSPGEAPPAPPKPLTVAELILRFKRHADAYYSGSREPANLRDAIRPVRSLFGQLVACEFGPLHLKKVRAAMIKAGLSRRVINARVNRVRRMFKWAVAEELVGPDVLARLRALEPLGPGRGGKERPPKAAVSQEHFEATLPHLPEMVAAMVRFAWLTGARPGEVISLTTGMIERKGAVWVATYDRHKNAHRGLTREVLIGPQAQAVLAPWLVPDYPDAPIFSPRRVDRRQPKRGGRRLPGKEYSRSAFIQVIRRACDRAGVPKWSPNALRHAAATRLRDEHGLEAAQVALGHRRPDTTLIYTAAAKDRAMKAIRDAG